MASPEPDLHHAFQIGKLLGKGGQGVVHRAVDANNNVFAAKLIASEKEREYVRGKITPMIDRLIHPNLARVWGFGVTDPILIYEYVDGVNLHDKLRKARGKLSQDELWPILIGVAAGIDHMHAQGFIHRDLKPPNIMIEANGVARIIDPDLACELVESAAEFTRWVGTRRYMPLEQIAEPIELHRKGDIYSLAVIIHECLTGRWIFDAPRPPHGPTAWEDAVRFQDLIVPPEIPPAAWDVLVQALDGDYEVRQDSASALVHDMRAAWENPRPRSVAPKTLAIQAVTSLLRDFGDLLGSLGRLLRDHHSATRTAKESLLLKLEAELSQASGMWATIVKNGARPERGAVPLLVDKLPMLDQLFEFTSALPNESLNDHAARIFTHLTVHLASWLRNEYLRRVDWPAAQDFRQAENDVRDMLHRWSDAIRGGETYPDRFAERLRHALGTTQDYPRSLPTILDRFDDNMLDQFLNAILQRITDLAKSGRSAECASFVTEAASAFWDATIALYRAKPKGPQLVAGFGANLISELAKAVSLKSPEILSILPRVLRSFDLHLRSGAFRRELLPVLQAIEKELLPRWSELAIQNPRFSRWFKEANDRGLRAMITGQFRDIRAADRFNLEGQQLHQRADVVPRLWDPSGRHHLPCALEDINKNFTGLRCAVFGGHPSIDEKNDEVWLTFGNANERTIVRLNQCSLEIPIESVDQDAGGPNTILSIQRRWVHSDGDVTRVGVSILGAKTGSLKNLAAAFSERFHFPFEADQD